MNIFRQINEGFEIKELKFSKTEERIFQYIRNNLYQIEQIGVSDIAENCYCSTAAIHRFVAKFGCQGYKDFKTQVITTKTLEMGAYSPFGKELVTMAKYVENLDVSAFKHNLEVLRNKRVYIFGSGGSNISANYFARLLCECEIDATAFSPFERAGMKSLADGVILISNTGDTSLVIDLANYYRAQKIPLYAITKQNSLLASLVDYALVHNHQFDRLKHSERESQLMLMMLIEKLFHQLL